MTHRMNVLVLSASLLLTACTAKDTKTGEAPPKDDGAKIAWADRTPKQKGQLMKDVVKPRMEALFQAHDKEGFAEFNCKTCHGPNAKKVKFKLPTKEIPKLNPANSFAAHKAEKPKMVEFMMNKVVPEMAKMLGVERWSPKTPKGLGCFTCHTKE